MSHSEVLRKQLEVLALPKTSLPVVLKVQGPLQKSENEVVEMLQALILAVKLLEQGLENETLTSSTYLSILGSLRSCFSELRMILKGQEFGGTEVTTLNELQMTLFNAGSRTSSSGGRY